MSSAAERWLGRRSSTGLVVAAAFFWFSLQPSLLPRSWVVQGVLTGALTTLGYGLGTAAGALLRRVTRRGRVDPDADRVPRDRGRRLARLGLAALAAALVVGSYVVSVERQAWTYERLGIEQPASRIVAATLVAILVACTLLAIAWMLRSVRNLLARGGRRLVGPVVGSVLATVVTVVVVVSLLNEYAYQRTLAGMNSSMSLSDTVLTPFDPDPPESSYATSGPGSDVDWAGLGDQGRTFLRRRPTAERIGEITGRPATEPIRLYVGRGSADSVDARVDLLMAELDRTDAWSRQVIAVNVPTGTGWMNEQLFVPLEYFYDGDTAVVGMQYSHLPSPIAFMAEHDAAIVTGRAMIDAVRGRLAAIPAAQRPMLVVTGESLGAYGGQGAFASLDAMASRVDRALWVGTPSFTTLRRRAERERLAGSPQIAPVVGDGRTVRFANRAADLEGTAPRITYLQNADDPIVWWEPSLAWHEPDWMAEERDPAVNPDLRWWPTGTFLAIALDMAVGNDFDEGNGHLYGTQPLDAWLAMLPQDDWDADQVAELRERLRGVR